MSEDNTLLTEAQIHAYVDNQLKPEERRKVEALLAISPEQQQLVMKYSRLNNALALNYTSMQDDSVPSHIMESLHRRGMSWQLLRNIAASIMIFVIGAGSGWLLKSTLAEPDNYFTALVNPAHYAHVVYSKEVLHPVEVAAENEQHLVTWLSKRVGGDVQAPKLQQLGFKLVGGRLLPNPVSPAAQFMYEDDNGRRLTLYLRKQIEDNRETSFRYAEQNGISTFYWVDQNFAYALTGEISRNQLLDAATVVYTRYSKAQ